MNNLNESLLRIVNLCFDIGMEGVPDNKHGIENVGICYSTAAWIALSFHDTYSRFLVRALPGLSRVQGRHWTSW